jgi:hypothetical protein
VGLDKLDKLSKYGGMQRTIPWPVIEQLAPEAGITAEAIRKAKERKRVPYRWHHVLMDIAQRKGVELQLKDLAA